ncbi:hypothetical protein LARV_01354 [Longilinea arvoryzae]|uniref:Uncharacterized protein n=2 Tax=Longilinea arvoryzae TaxID=360412 RepID=A0A0S7B817_9CHLR|nr:hypothetical protein LARV_01354 [Longilinea arvoryzae]
MDYGQSQLLDLSRKATQTSLDMAQAATVSQSAYLLNVSQTEQAQAILDTQIAQTKMC